MYIYVCVCVCVYMCMGKNYIPMNIRTVCSAYWYLLIFSSRLGEGSIPSDCFYMTFPLFLHIDIHPTL